MTQTSGLLAGKRGLVMGIANDHSIAWGIAQSLHAHGAELAFTYQTEAIKRRVLPLAEKVGCTVVLPCDVGDPASLDTVFGAIEDAWGTLDFVVHAVAYSDKEELKGRFLDTTAENFARTMQISAYSLTAVTQRACRLMPEGGNILTLTYLGAERVMPNYNVMGVAKAALEASVRYLAADLGPIGIRVNAISAGPMRTLAGSAIANARYVFRFNEANAPLRRNVSLSEIGGTALFLLSDLGSGITGEVIHVDSGYHVLGMPGVPTSEKEPGTA